MGAGAQELEGRTLVVTGAAGFLGRALLDQLAPLACRVVTLGRPGSARPPGPRGQHLVGDILDAGSLATSFGAVRPDTVIHLAAQTAPPRDAEQRRAMLAVNVLGTESVLAAAARAGAASAVVVGSAAQYGPMAQGGRALREDDPCRPVGAYGISKAAAGQLALDFGASFGLPVTLALPFNVIGAGQPPHLVPATFIRQVVALPAAGAGCIAVGDIAAQRDWVDVRDVARALVLLAAQRLPGAYNICTGSAVAVSELLAILQRLSARRFDLAQDPARLRPGQPSVQFGDPSKLRDATGWRAQVTLEDSLAAMLLMAGGQVRDREPLTP